MIKKFGEATLELLCEWLESPCFQQWMPRFYFSKYLMVPFGGFDPQAFIRQNLEMCQSKAWGKQNVTTKGK